MYAVNLAELDMTPEEFLLFSATERLLEVFFALVLIVNKPQKNDKAGSSSSKNSGRLSLSNPGRQVKFI